MDAAERVCEDEESDTSSRPGFRPIFVDDSGARRRRLRVSGFGAALFCSAYVALVILGLVAHGPVAGLRLPLVPHPGHTTAATSGANDQRAGAPSAVLGLVATGASTRLVKAGSPGDSLATQTSSPSATKPLGNGPTGGASAPPTTVASSPTTSPVIPGSGHGSGQGSPPTSPGGSATAPGHTDGKAAAPSR